MRFYSDWPVEPSHPFIYKTKFDTNVQFGQRPVLYSACLWFIKIKMIEFIKKKKLG